MLFMSASPLDHMISIMCEHSFSAAGATPPLLHRAAITFNVSQVVELHLKILRERAPVFYALVSICWCWVALCEKSCIKCITAAEEAV